MPKIELELILGVCSLIVGAILSYKEILLWDSYKNNDWSMKASSIKIIGASLILLLVGVAGIYRYFH